MNSRDCTPNQSGAPAAPLRVLHVINGLGAGGAETVLYRLAVYPSAVEHEIVCLEGREWYSEKLEDAGVKVHHLGWRSFSLAAPFRLYRLIQSSRADVVQAWMYRSNVIAGLFSKRAGKPVVWGIHCSSLGPLRRASRLLARLSGILASWVPDFVINCSAQSAALHNDLGYDPQRGKVIHNGYDSAIFFPDDAARIEVRKSLAVEEDVFVLGTIARWHQQKGIPVLVRALELLRQRELRTKLVLIGAGLDSNNVELAKLIASCGCLDDVQLIGVRPDIPEIARALDIHVLASLGSEAFPNAVAETMLSGVPNVVTDIGDCAMMVNGSGWVVSPGDAVELANAIEEAYREWSLSTHRWSARRRAARSRITENFSLERMANAYECVWRQVTRANGNIRPT